MALPALLVIVAGVLAKRHFESFDLGAIIAQLVVLFYGFELLVSRESKGIGARVVGAGACYAGVMLAGRAFL